MYIYHIFLIQSSVDGHFGCFHDLAIVNSASMNIGMHEYFWINVFVFFPDIILSSGVAGSYGSSIFSFLRNLHAFPWRRQWQPTPVLLPGKSHGWRSLVGCSPSGCRVWQTERLHFHFQEDILSVANQPIQSLSGSLSTSPNHPQARPQTAKDKPCTRSLPQLFKLDSQKPVCLLRPLLPAETTGEALTHSSPAS